MCRAAHRSWDADDWRDERIQETRPPVMDDTVRVSDEDRQRVIEALRMHTAEGRLTLDEFAERVGETWAARTHGELRLVLRELPVPEPQVQRQPPRPPEWVSSRPRRMPVGLMVATLVVVGSLLMSHFAWWLIPVGFWVFGACGAKRHRGVDRRSGRREDVLISA